MTWLSDAEPYLSHLMYLYVLCILFISPVVVLGFFRYFRFFSWMLFSSPSQPSAMFMIYPSQISSVLFFTPPPRTLLYSVLLRACASALQTLLKSFSGLTLPSPDNPIQSVPLASSRPFLFLLDLPVMFTTLLLFF